MKRAIVLIGLFSMCLLAGVSSFSNSYGISKADLTVTGPRQALISVFEKDSICIDASGACTPGTIAVLNNLDMPITITSVVCRDDALAGLFHIDAPTAEIPSGQYDQILLSLNAGQSSQDLPEMLAPFQLEARWDSGHAVIDFKAMIHKQAPSPEEIPNDAPQTDGIAKEPAEQPAAAVPSEPGNGTVVFI